MSLDNVYIRLENAGKSRLVKKSAGFYHSRSYVSFFVVVNNMLNTRLISHEDTKTPSFLLFAPSRLCVSPIAVVQYHPDHYIMSHFCSKWIVKATFFRETGIWSHFCSKWIVKSTFFRETGIWRSPSSENDKARKAGAPWPLTGRFHTRFCLRRGYNRRGTLRDNIDDLAIYLIVLAALRGL